MPHPSHVFTAEEASHHPAFFLVHVCDSKATRRLCRPAGLRPACEASAEKLLDHVGMVGRKVLDGLRPSASAFSSHESSRPADGPDEIHQMESCRIGRPVALGRRDRARETRGATMKEATLRVFRGETADGKTVDYRVPLAPGMVVLDALHYVQGHLAPDLAVRWNCKAGKCGSCSAAVNGRPRLTCKTRMDSLPLDQPVTLLPMKSFPVIKDLVTDVSWNFRVNKKIPPFQPRPGAEWKIDQRDVDRVQEFRKCIECFLCQNVCHVLREHDNKKEEFAGPRFFVRVAGLEMHPMDSASRGGLLRKELGIGLCNITKCCTEVCPEEIHITDNAIIPLKERVVDEFYDPLLMLVRKIRGAR